MTVIERDDITALRDAMVASQLRPNAVTDQRVVAAMASVLREDFLPGVPTTLAYRDTVQPLGEARYANSPLATGRLLTAGDLRPSDRVLLIGAAGGYAAAVLAQIVAEVVAVESDPRLAEHARGTLALTPGVTVIEGPLEAGHAAGAPYDVLFIDGAVEIIPDFLVEQVAMDGRAVSGMVDRGVLRLAVGRRSPHGFRLVPFADIDGAVLPGFDRSREFVF